MLFGAYIASFYFTNSRELYAIYVCTDLKMATEASLFFVVYSAHINSLWSKEPK